MNLGWTEVMSVVPEMLVGLFLLVLGWGFRNWASTVRSTSDQVLKELRDYRAESKQEFGKVYTEISHIRRDFNAHQVQTERRVSRMEGRVYRQIKDLYDDMHSEGGNG